MKIEDEREMMVASVSTLSMQSSVQMIKQNTKLTYQFGIGTTTDGIPILFSDSARDRNSSSVKICRYVICMYM